MKKKMTTLNIRVPRLALMQIEGVAKNMRPAPTRNAYIRTLLEMAASGEIELPVGKREEVSAS